MVLHMMELGSNDLASFSASFRADAAPQDDPAAAVDEDDENDSAARPQSADDSAAGRN